MTTDRRARHARAGLLLVALTMASASAQSEGDEAARTWVAPHSRAQLAMEASPIPVGKGMLFVPTMTSGTREPRYLVYQVGREVAAEETGRGVLLDAGRYELLVGSGPVSQMMRREVEVREGMTTLVKPWWAGLVVDVIDEARLAIKESYELFNEETQENYGVGFGVEEERGEAVNTWLLDPGTYTVVRTGENLATTHRLSLRLLGGELAQRNLVADANGLFVGFFPAGYLEGAGVTSNWNSRWELSMSTLFNTSQNTAGEDRSSVSFSGQARNRTRYNSERHFYDLRLITEEGFTRASGGDLRKSIDEVEVRTTYILRLSKRLGPYLRGVLNSHFFPTKIYPDTPRDLTILDADGGVLQVRPGVTQFTLEPSYYPLRLRQGAGINSQLYRSFPLNLDLRVGFGARQAYYSGAYRLAANDTTVQELRDATSTGMEALLITDARLSRYISLDSEFDILVPAASTDEWEFSFENRIRTFLTAYINMDVVLDFERRKPLNRVQSRQQVLLRFVKLL
ncbi:MAG: hypothetical protein AB1505_24510 [Candidatus Latescibacterota bacterium]